MAPEEIDSLAAVASGLGIRKVKLTGGEPLARGDIVEIVRRIAPRFQEVSMTTNGVRLAPIARDLAEAGLARVNVSLNSLREGRYTRICGAPLLEDVIAGIDGAIEAGLTPVKLNTVLLRGINDDEVPDLLQFASQRGVILQVIELEIERERVSSQMFAEYHADLNKLRDWLLVHGRPNGANPLHNRERYLVESLPDGGTLPAPTEVELVMPMHNTTFCANCTRIRLTAGGYVKGCLFDRENVNDLLGPLREGADVAELERRILGVASERRPYWTEVD
jgi:cyclic pyranopterin phosphate synthase